MPRPRKAKVEIIPYEPNSIVIPDDQFRRMEAAILESKKPNPLPWVVVGLALVLFAVVGGMGLVVAILKPTPAPIQTQMVVIPPTVTPLPTVTKTPTSTSTPDMTATRLYHPAMDTIRKYFERLEMADYGSAWHLMTERCKYSLCWDTFKSDYKLYIETMRRYGPISIEEIRPEDISKTSASAFVVLFYKWQMQPHSYRFFLLYDGDAWKLDTVEFISLVK